jgi:hypothetical protein
MRAKIMPSTPVPLPTTIPTFSPVGRLDDAEEGISELTGGFAAGGILFVELLALKDGPMIF